MRIPSLILRQPTQSADMCWLVPLYIIGKATKFRYLTVRRKPNLIPGEVHTYVWSQTFLTS